MSYDLATLRTAPAWSAAAPKFGSHSLSAGVLGSAADSFLSSTGAAGGTLTTGTIEGWIKTTAAGTKIWCGHDNWYWFGVAGGKVTLHYGNGSTEQIITSTTSVNDGAWWHVAAVFVAGAASLYVGQSGTGNREATSSTVRSVGTAAQNTFTLGGFGDAGLAPFDWAYGGIDEVRISSTARYTGATYTVPSAAFTPDADTVALYHLDNDAHDGATVTPPPPPPPPPTSGANILPDDPALLYSPYNWLVGHAAAETINPGAYFRAAIAGSATALTLLFDVTNLTGPLPQVAYRVDNGGWQTATVAATVPVALPAGNAWTVHTLEVVVKSTTETVNRWNAPRNASVKFLGIDTTPDTCTLRPVTPKALKVAVFGDSITEGVRTLNATATDDTDRNDARVGWAWRLGDELGAEVGCIGFGGTGLLGAGSGNVPAVGTNYASLWAGQPRDLTTAPLDVIVVNIGTNDGTGNTISAGTALLDGLLATTPSSTHVLVMRPFNGAQATNLQAAITACSDPTRVTYVDTTSWWSASDASDSLHPYGYANVTTLAPKLAAAIREVLADGALYLTVAGHPIVISVHV